MDDHTLNPAGTVRRSQGRRGRRPSALAASAFQRLAYVALPTLVLWLSVVFALDVFA